MADGGAGVVGAGLHNLAGLPLCARLPHLQGESGLPKQTMGFGMRVVEIRVRMVAT